MDWELFGRLIICIGIIGSIILFATVNANYLPPEENDPEGNKKENSS